MSSALPAVPRASGAVDPSATLVRLERRALQSMPLGWILTIAAALVAATAEKVLETPFWSFNSTRLLPSFFLFRGMRVFSPPHVGSLQSTMYGPVTLLTYLPTAIMRTPNAAVLVGSVISVLLCFGVALWMHVAAGRGLWRTAWLPFLTTGFMILYLDPLSYSCIRIHADAPAIFFGALAVIAICSRQRLRAWRLPVSAVCVVLSVWAKQPFIGVALGLCIFVGVTEGGKRLLQFVLLLAAAAAVISGVFVAWFGFHALYFNLIWIPAREPWQTASKLTGMFQNSRWLIVIAFPVMAGLLACLFSVADRRITAASLRSMTGGKMWCASLLVGLCLIPFSLMGASKAGGDYNSFSFCLFFLLVALTLFLEEATIASAYPLARVARAAMLGLMGAAMAFTVPFIALIPARAKALPMAEEEVAFRYLRAHPGKAYFPYYPLVHLMAENRSYNTPFGVWDHMLAGVGPTQQEFDAHIPRSAQIVAFGKEGPNVHGTDMMRFFPQFQCASHDAELPGFVVLTRRLPGSPCQPIPSFRR